MKKKRRSRRPPEPNGHFQYHSVVIEHTVRRYVAEHLYPNNPRMRAWCVDEQTPLGDILHVDRTVRLHPLLLHNIGMMEGQIGLWAKHSPQARALYKLIRVAQFKVEGGYDATHEVLLVLNATYQTLAAAMQELAEHGLKFAGGEKAAKEPPHIKHEIRRQLSAHRDTPNGAILARLRTAGIREHEDDKGKEVWVCENTGEEYRRKTIDNWIATIRSELKAQA